MDRAGGFYPQGFPVRVGGGVPLGSSCTLVLVMDSLTAKVALRYQASALRVANRFGKPLYGYDSMENSYLVNDYPYGRTLRCKIRYWLEFTPKKGWRFCSQTQDPRNERWNKPKKSTYMLLGGAMYLDSREHVQWTGIGEYSKDEDILEFVKAFPQADFRVLRQFLKTKILYLQTGAEGRNVWLVNGKPQPVTDDDIGRYRKELETWQAIERLVK